MAKKSVAETVNLQGGVQTPQYQKAAAQVDTFEQVESAESRLKRSGKMQTAKAIEALASLGDSAAKFAGEQEQQRHVELSREMETFTSQAINELNSGTDYRKSEYYQNLPNFMRMQLADDVARRMARQDGLKAMDGFAEQGDFYNYDAKVENYWNSNISQKEDPNNPQEVFFTAAYNDEMSAQKASYLSKVYEQRTAYNTEAVTDSFGLQVSDAIYQETRVITAAREAGQEISELQYQINAAAVHEKIQNVFVDPNIPANKLLTPKMKKDKQIELLIDAAKTTNNPFLIHPDYVPEAFKDEKTAWLFSGVLDDLKSKQLSDQTRANTLASQQLTADYNDAVDAVIQGEITWDTPDRTTAQTLALQSQTNKLTANPKESFNISSDIQESIEAAVSAGQDKVVINGNEVNLTEADLRAFIDKDTRIGINDGEGLKTGLADALAPKDALKNYNKSTGVRVENEITRRGETDPTFMLDPGLVDDVRVQTQRYYEDLYAELVTSGRPINRQNLRDIEDRTIAYFRGEMNSASPTNSGKTRVDANGDVIQDTPVTPVDVPKLDPDAGFRKTWEHQQKYNTNIRGMNQNGDDPEPPESSYQLREPTEAIIKEFNERKDDPKYLEEYDKRFKRPT